MRVLSTEMRQVFRAYTKQLRQTPAKDGNEESEPVKMRRGYEQVELSQRARELAASSANAEEATVAEEPVNAENPVQTEEAVNAEEPAEDQTESTMA